MFAMIALETCRKNEKQQKDGWLQDMQNELSPKSGMSEFINGISYVFYHNSYLKYYLFLIILMRIKRNSIQFSSILHFSPVVSCSDVGDADTLSIEWVDKRIYWTA